MKLWEYALNLPRQLFNNDYSFYNAIIAGITTFQR